MRNWSNLAEVGFGLNPAVQDLTGLGVVDEKKAHTVHIALGHSAGLGGDVESVIHCDMVAKRPTVYVNGRLIMKAAIGGSTRRTGALDHRNGAAPPGWWKAWARLRAAACAPSARWQADVRLERRAVALGQRSDRRGADGPARGAAV